MPWVSIGGGRGPGGRGGRGFWGRGGGGPLITAIFGQERVWLPAMVPPFYHRSSPLHQADYIDNTVMTMSPYVCYFDQRHNSYLIRYGDSGVDHLLAHCLRLRSQVLQQAQGGQTSGATGGTNNTHRG